MRSLLNAFVFCKLTDNIIEFGRYIESINTFEEVEYISIISKVIFNE